MSSLEVLVFPLTFIAAGLVGLALLPTGYLGFLAVLGWPHQATKPKARTLRFRFLVPAHNEEQGIASTVESLLAVTWPRTPRSSPPRPRRGTDR